VSPDSSVDSSIAHQLLQQDAAFGGAGLLRIAALLSSARRVECGGATGAIALWPTR
jgi:hypothetical protein